MGRFKVMAANCKSKEVEIFLKVQFINCLNWPSQGRSSATRNLEMGELYDLSQEIYLFEGLTDKSKNSMTFSTPI